MVSSAGASVNGFLDHHFGHDPIAIVGMSCRLPGAPDPEAFWRLLAGGTEAIGEVPPGRWEPADHTVRRGGFLDRVDAFDAEFFGISPREAREMDPQQRLMLELGWEALEDALIVPATLAAGRTGVYVGAIWDDYATLVHRAGPEAVGRHTVTGLSRGVIAGRLSYVLGLRGPSLTVDSAQSSSLVAVHLAAQSLRGGDCDLALAGGVSLALSARTTLGNERFGGLSPSGVCRAFDARADGYVRGEGGAVVVLKPLRRALADGDRVYCVIRGGAVNNDGATEGLTVPGAQTQAAVLTEAYARAGIDPAEAQYVELHGTGTRVGDPVEAAALGAALGRAEGRRRPLMVGSVKTNIGHLEGAAGIAGLVKAALSVHRRRLPASLNFVTPSPRIPLDELGLDVVRAFGSWPEPERPLVAGVSSFGMGGTNCHLVLEQAPDTEEPGGECPRLQPPLLLSGRSAQALRAQAERVREAVAAGADLPGVAHALAVGRTHFAHRAAVPSSGDRATVVEALDTLAAGGMSAGVRAGRVDGDGGVGLMFSGQGDALVGVGSGLYRAFPVFAEAFEEAAGLVGLPAGGPGAMGDAAERGTRWVQAGVFALQVALVRLLADAGVRPSVVVGHSVGEVAAAHGAGALSLEEAARLVVARGRLMGQAPQGAMVAVRAPEEEVRAALEPGVTVAAVNSPTDVVVSGEEDAVREVMGRFARTRRLPVGQAFHSPAMAAAGQGLREVAAGLSFHEPVLTMVSTVTGRAVGRAELADPGYWARQVEAPVLFAEAVREVRRLGTVHLVEAGPSGTLTSLASATLSGSGVRATALLRRGRDEETTFTAALADLHTHSLTPDWSRLTGPRPPHPAPLPTYPFQRSPYWFTAPTEQTVAVRESGERPETAEETGQVAKGAEAAQPVVGAEQAVVSQGAEAGPEPASSRRAGIGGAGLRQLVRAHTAAVLGHDRADAVAPDRSFKDLGFDSLSGVELAERLAEATGRALPATSVYDHPTPAALAAFLAGEESADAARGSEDAAESVTADAGGATPEEGTDDPVVVVGLGCRFPGGVNSPEDLWDMLFSGIDVIGDFPADRGWDLEELFDPDPERPGTSYVREGGFLAGAAWFDHGFFGISPREARAMDPQQRLLLETCWEALERAGIDPTALHGSDTGVFVGATAAEYGPRLADAAAGAEGYALTGTTPSVASGRVAYVLGLRGPAVTVDTACSSSLVALHLAVQSVRSGECPLAVVGGATVMATPGMFVEFSRQRGLAPDGRCKAFSSDADGTAWSEGVGVLVVERLSRARAAGHPVLAVVRSTALNQDGASNGLTAPSRGAQEQVIRRALKAANLAPAEVDVVEAHGTGTRLGDPIEAEALLATYGQHRQRPLLLGSVKSNLGHAQAAAGMASMMKLVLAMGHGWVPRTLHVDEPTPHADWSSGSITLATEGQRWPDTPGRPRRAGVSAFGISGTNAHAVLEQAPPEPVETGHPAGPETLPAAVPYLLSARDAAALRDQATALHAHLEEQDAAPVQVAHALLYRRTRHTHRAAVVATGRDDLLRGLTALAAGETDAEGTVVGTAGETGRVVFVFPGQGAQWPGMATALTAESPVFAARMAECAAALGAYVDWDLSEVLSDTEALRRVDVVQPALWAVMVSLAALWRAHGLEPDAVVGHSQGEIAAACVAGALSLEDAAKVVALRSRVILALSGRGGMLSVGLSAAAIAELLDDGLSVAAVNGPSSVVVSGDRAPLERLAAYLTEQGVRNRMVPVDYASHSAHVEAIRAELADALAQLRPTAPLVPFLSTVTGAWVETAALDAAYWYRNLRETVGFEQAVRTLGDQGFTTFVEMSPHPVLTYPVEETCPEAVVTGTLQREDGGLRRFLESAAGLVVRGVDLELLPGVRGGHLPLPVYRFQRSRFWQAPLRGTAPAPDPQTPPEETTNLRRLVAGAPADEGERLLLDLVRARAAAVLGHDSADQVPQDRNFKELGLDSLGAVRLRNTLAAATELRLPPTLVFTYPTPAALARFLYDTLRAADSDVPAEEPAPAPGTPAAQAAPESDDPVVVVAMACRFPGGVHSPEDLWEVLESGRDVVGDFPTDRGWDLERLYDPDPEHAGTSYVRTGGFLQDAGAFDHQFFGISPREARAMDPQQRLLLETCWEALERAGIDPTSLRGSGTGVFVGATGTEYGPRLHEADPDAEGFALTGTAMSVASGRIAYTYGLTGPAVTVDTACSGSLMALHLAVQALRSGECPLAVVGGATVMAAPGIFVEFSRQRGLAPDGRCKPFSADADGTAWSEGVGVLLVERLSRARRLGHPVLAVVRGTAANQDGASNGLTAPSRGAQEQVIRRALKAANLAPAEVDVVEAHGTGTRLGDPIEAEALLATYGQHRQRPLLLGSVKSNLGHTQAAAGMAGVIKMILAMRHGVVPRTLYVGEPTPHVDWSAGDIALTTADRPWPDTDRPRRAAVSAFGISGTNCHAVLEQAPAVPAVAEDRETPAPIPLLLSARTPAALRAQARALLDRLTTRPDPDIAGTAHALAVGRAHHPHRAAVLLGDGNHLAGLKAVAEGLSAIGVQTGHVDGDGRVALMFSGQGDLYAGMGSGLYTAFPAFAEAFDEAAALVGLERGGPDVLDEALLGRTRWAQAAVFALEVGLFRLLQAAGIRPSVVVGHSVGEVAAAHCAGVLTLPDAAELVVARGTLMQQAPAGAMVAVRAPVEDVRAALTPGVSVAAVNSPLDVVLAGEEEAVARVAGRFRRSRRLPVGQAFHSPAMARAAQGIGEVAAGLAFAEPEITLVSSVTGRPAGRRELADPEYWAEQVRGPVRFLDAVREVHRAGATHLVEAGPAGTLTSLAAATPGSARWRTALLRRGRDEATTFTAALAELHAHTATPDWSRLAGPLPPRPVTLPPYAFQHTHHWIAPPAHPAGTGNPLAGLGGNLDAETLAARLGVDPDAPLREVLPALRAWRPQPTPSADPRSTEQRASGAVVTLPESEADRRAALLELVRVQAAAVLGHEAHTEIGGDTEFFDVGLASMGALELRHRIGEATGLDLPSTLLYDHPTPAELVAFLEAELAGPENGEGD
ncbi:beta-ketoacyl synthase N-terminal-like domain-containing protein [Streptomyces sp. NPDC051172]|uniref:type I polyketide synthase n=1 Tax=Streptomyces sp. NPDC051172 TaxID=3155796 RepID=UPI0034337304